VLDSFQIDLGASSAITVVHGHFHHLLKLASVCLLFPDDFSFLVIRLVGDLKMLFTGVSAVVLFEGRVPVNGDSIGVSAE